MKYGKVEVGVMLDQEEAGFAFESPGVKLA
jgi:hypothetical protein